MIWWCCHIGIKCLKLCLSFYMRTQQWYCMLSRRKEKRIISPMQVEAMRKEAALSVIQVCWWYLLQHVYHPIFPFFWVLWADTNLLMEPHFPGIGFPHDPGLAEQGGGGRRVGGVGKSLSWENLGITEGPTCSKACENNFKWFEWNECVYPLGGVACYWWQWGGAIVPLCQ